MDKQYFAHIGGVTRRGCVKLRLAYGFILVPFWRHPHSPHRTSREDEEICTAKNILWAGTDSILLELAKLAAWLALVTATCASSQRAG